ncbi:MAG: sodium:calcium antiporter, partial [Nanoarchaeota archaeon]|nr:sodium:calcium antiporter [Nanoarchaeota archaeon]
IALFILANSTIIDGSSSNMITRTSGIIFLLFFSVFLYYSIEVFKQTRKKLTKKGANIKKRSPLLITAIIVGGLIALIIGGKWTVDGAVQIANLFGLSQFLISATVIALGTSLPELATAITAAKRNETGIIVGNVAGANIFNIFWIIGITAIIAPIAVPEFINMDIAFMGIATLLLLGFIFVGKRGQIERWQGIIFIILYAAYVLSVILRG